MRTDRWTDIWQSSGRKDGRTDGHRRYNIIPHHYFEVIQENPLKLLFRSIHTAALLCLAEIFFRLRSFIR